MFFYFSVSPVLSRGPNPALRAFREVLVAAIALKKAKTEEDRLKVKTAVKGAMHKVMAKLKTDVTESARACSYFLSKQVEKSGS